MAKKIAEKHQPWVEARRRYYLSDAHIQMTRELGLNPKKFGGLSNSRQEPWKAPLPEFIEELYFKGLSLRKLSLEVGISHNNLASCERDAIVPSLENAVKISQYFDVALEYHFMGETAEFKYHDLELADLFGEVDRMEAKYRRMVKNYIRKAIKHKNEEERMLRESAPFELNQSESRKPAEYPSSGTVPIK